MTYVCRMSCTRYYPGHALVREARRSASGRPRGCRESRVERRSASGADGAANGGCGGRRAAAASSTHRPLCGRTAGRPLPERPSARRQRRRWRRAATATCGPRRGCSRALLLCTRKASDEAVSDAEGLRDVGARVGLCGRCMQEAGLREERARTPEPRELAVDP